MSQIDMIDCYFYIAGDPEDDSAQIKALCLECQKNLPNFGWPYKGSCGPWEVRCGKCGWIIKEGVPEAIPDSDQPSFESLSSDIVDERETF